MKSTTFAGGCFWCTEHDLRGLPGVVSAMPGYANSANDIARPGFTPDYHNHNGYREAVKIDYDESVTNFKKLCQFYLDSIDPTDGGGQFHDRGDSYKTAMYYNDDSEKQIAENLLAELSQSGIFDKPISVDILPVGTFTTAEEYHQNYSAKNPDQYMNYRIGSGREAFVQNTCRLRNDIPWRE